jgi:hypothetical protein
MTGAFVVNDTVLGILFGCVCGSGILAGIAVLVVGTIFKTRFGINFASVFGRAKCAECGEPAPEVVRIPKTPYQMLWGGWTCEECGLELDKWGNPR